MNDIINERYPAHQWNIYAAQASDGDNWADDSPQCREILARDIMPRVRYYSYIEITTRAHQTCGTNMNRSPASSPTSRCNTSQGRGYLSGLPGAVQEASGVRRSYGRNRKKVAPLDDGPDWNFDLLDIYHQR
jgi:hypothetical protein